MEAVVQELLLDVGAHDRGLVVVAVEGRRRGAAAAHLVDAVQTAPAPAALLAHLVREDAPNEAEEEQDDHLGQGQPDAHPQELLVVLLKREESVSREPDLPLTSRPFG